MRDVRGSNLPVSEGWPRELYGLIVGLGLWLAISIWGFCGAGYTALVMAVIALLIATAVGVAAIVVLAIQRRGRPRAAPAPGSLAAWLGSEFEAHTGRLKGAAAAAQVILPLAAVAFAMTLFAIIRHIDLVA